MTTKNNGNVFLACVLLTLSGCKAAGCSEYKKLFHDEKAAGELLEWADAEIFSRRFEKRDFRVAGIVGPGRKGENFAPERTKMRVPDWLNGFIIRSIGPDRFEPEFIFVGKRRYQGWIISRNALSEVPLDPPLEDMQFEGWKGRVGWICYID